ncbi:MAG TPA: glycosyltransferase, partial [Caulobacteraceae bacterium]|nr:glycosyltransferase [Caulobacteraceae bacterium]
MARFLFATWEGGGHVQPMMLVARGMAARGHQVLMLSDACNAAEAEALGVPFRAWRRAPSRPNKDPSTDPLRDWEHKTPMEVITGLCDAVITGPAGRYAADVLEALDEFAADIVVSMELLFGVMAAAEARGVPLAILSSNLWCFPTLPSTPPFGAGLPLPADDDARELYEKIAVATRDAYQTRLPALNAVRDSLGLAPLADFFHQLDRARRILMATSKTFDFGADLPAQFVHVGPYLTDPVWVQPSAPIWSEEDPTPKVLVSFSTMYQGQDETLERVIDALGGLPVKAVVTLGPVLNPEDFSPPANVHVVKNAPHDPLLAQAALAINHAGHASLLRPLMAGVPVLCMPMGRDQEDNTIRASTAGAALR